MPIKDTEVPPRHQGRDENLLAALAAGRPPDEVEERNKRIADLQQEWRRKQEERRLNIYSKAEDITPPVTTNSSGSGITRRIALVALAGTVVVGKKAFDYLETSPNGGSLPVGVSPQPLEDLEGEKPPFIKSLPELKAPIQQVFDLAKAETAVDSKAPYRLEEGNKTLTESQTVIYKNIVRKFHGTLKNSHNYQAFTEALRDLGKQPDEDKTAIAGMLLYRGAKAANEKTANETAGGAQRMRDGTSLVADVLVYVKGAKDIAFKVDTISTVPFEGIMQYGTPPQSGDITPGGHSSLVKLEQRKNDAAANLASLYGEKPDTQPIPAR